MNRAGIFGLVLLSLIGGCADRPDTARPNFVFIVADDLSWNDVGAFGNPGIKTPHIDALADAGLKFTNAFVTASSCSPSRASMLTGRFPHSTGAQHLHTPLPADQITFAELLQDAGYYAASVGKWHLGGAARRGFDVVIEKQNADAEGGAAEWIEALRRRPEDKPFLFWLASFDPHRPYEPPDAPAVHSPEDVWVPPFMFDGPRTRHELMLYYDEIHRLDGYVGRVVAELERQGVLQNTLVVFLSDNGRPFHRAKTSLYDSGIKTPLIVRWSGHVAAGGETDALVSAIDFAPTVLELAGVDIPGTVQGRSFVPQLQDPAAASQPYVYAEHNWHGRDAHERAVRSQDYLYIRNQWPEFGYCHRSQFAGTDAFQEFAEAYRQGRMMVDLSGCFAEKRAEEELYDVHADPFSLRNLAGDPAQADQLATYRRVLDEWRSATADPDFVPY